MNRIRFLRLGLAIALMGTILAGCGAVNQQQTVPTEEKPAETAVSEKPAETTLPEQEAETTTPVTLPQSSGRTLLQKLTLTLPINVTREAVSDTRDYFVLNGEVVGGIALVDLMDLEGQPDPQEVLGQCQELAISVTQEVYPKEYDSISGSSAEYCQYETSLVSADGSEFNHYFVYGRESDYDIWLDARYHYLESDLVPLPAGEVSVLASMASEDFLSKEEIQKVSYDSTVLEEDGRIQTMSVDIPESIQHETVSSTRILFRSGETIIGGIEQIRARRHHGVDLWALRMAVQDFSGKLLGKEFGPLRESYVETRPAVGRIRITSGDQNLTHYIVFLEDQTYTVWGDPTFIDEETLLSIAVTCKY